METGKIYRLNREQLTASPTAPTASLSSSATKPKLLDQVRQAIRTRHLSLHTEQPMSVGSSALSFSTTSGIRWRWVK
jgi:hypothetical protein